MNFPLITFAFNLTTYICSSIGQKGSKFCFLLTSINNENKRKEVLLGDGDH